MRVKPVGAARGYMPQDARERDADVIRQIPYLSAGRLPAHGLTRS